ncbi:hypothetical protein QCM79_42200 [Bradyrhizobium sp. SSUT77]|nr:hypothetical protein [Bradyrhizobium sp. SSUT77]
MAQRDGGERRELRGVAVVESIGIDGEQRTEPVERTHRHRSGHDRGDITVEQGMLVAAGCRSTRACSHRSSSARGIAAAAIDDEAL